MPKIYTKTGDAGKTRLWDGTLVGKNDPHIETNGALDELNAALGLARSLAPASVRDEINEFQGGLVRLMAYVARGKKPQPAPNPEELEKRIDVILEEYPMGDSFVNPGESPAGGAIHMARAMARRAERWALQLLEPDGDIEPQAYRYINRLSDFLFAFAHKVDVESSVELITKEVVSRTGGISETKTQSGGHGVKKLNLDTALELLSEARRKAESIGKKLVFAIVDASGELVALHRMEGALLVSIAHAQSKARSAVRIQLDTKDITPLAQPGAPFYGVQNEPEFFSIIGGGRLLRDGGEIVGAIGVSGGAIDEDLSVADAAVSLFEKK
ncbi:MAG: cob(I)yrinic acid a,c-diamide adenosyltransferase [Synergistaceae bacterium]|jgi:ATP:cob(I)alamin adenosyltransferase|nr:cob(I)yrinic acid a,c-diamide adenosyltransferase [Synergistaceae bacterium]